MSRKNMWQICHKNEFDNKQLTKDIVSMLRCQGITHKQVALELDMTVWRVHNWYYQSIGMSALDLLRMIQTYDFIRETVENSMSMEEN